MVRRRDHHRVQVTLLEQLPVVLIRRHLPVHGLRGGAQVVPVYVAQGADVILERVEMEPAHPPESDVPRHDAVVGARSAAHAQYGPGQYHWRHGSPRNLEESPSRDRAPSVRFGRLHRTVPVFARIGVTAFLDFGTPQQF